MPNKAFNLVRKNMLTGTDLFLENLAWAAPIIGKSAKIGRFG